MVTPAELIIESAVNDAPATWPSQDNRDPLVVELGFSRTSQPRDSAERRAMERRAAVGQPTGTVPTG